MPTHNDLLDAEVAFILYDGQVYMTNPTDRDVSLTRLIGQMDDLGYIDTPLVQSIQAFLRGEEEAPQGLGLVGRYHMSNGRMAPYGPVNSPENQELVRQTIQQSLYNAPQTPQEPVSGDPARGMAPTVSKWRFGREFMPHVEKMGPGECPLCSQKRTLYHPSDHYKAQAMGVYGVGLCRDCLTTRMDQHEYLMGQRIARIMAEGADIKELANRKREQLKPQIDKLAEGVPQPVSYMHPSSVATRLLISNPLPDEYFKLYDWIFAQIKRGGIDADNESEARTFITHELGPLLAVLKEKNKPWPDLKSKEFDIDAAEAWLNAPENLKILEQAGMGLDKTGPYGNEDDPIVYTFDDGYTIRSLSPYNTQAEGEEMGNCIEDNDEYHWADKINDGYIYILSLRDQRNNPHVSWAVDRAAFDAGNLMTVEGPYGKENKAPIEKYQKYLDQYMNEITENGGQVGTSYTDYDGMYNEEPEHDEDADEIEWSNSITIDNLDQLEEFWHDFKINPHNSFGVGPNPYEGANQEFIEGTYDGRTYYYYQIDAGTEVEATEQDLDAVVDEIYERLQSDFEVPPAGSPPADKAEDDQLATVWEKEVRDYAAAMVAAAYLSDNHGYRSNPTRIGLNLAQRALDQHNGLKSGNTLVPQGLAISALLIKCLETLGSKNFSRLPYPGKEVSTDPNLARYFTSYTDEIPFEPNAEDPRGHDEEAPRTKSYEDMVAPENRPSTEWTSEIGRPAMHGWLRPEIGETAAISQATRDNLVYWMGAKFHVPPDQANDVINEYLWNHANPGGYLEQEQARLPEPAPATPGLEIPGFQPALVQIATSIIQELDSTLFNHQPYPEDAKRNLFATKLQRKVFDTFDAPQNYITIPDGLQLYDEIRAKQDVIEVGDTPPNPLWEQMSQPQETEHGQLQWGFQ